MCWVADILDESANPGHLRLVTIWQAREAVWKLVAKPLEPFTFTFNHEVPVTELMYGAVWHETGEQLVGPVVGQDAAQH